MVENRDVCFQEFKLSCCLQNHSCTSVFGTPDQFMNYMASCGPAIDNQACELVPKAVPAACLVGLK